MSKGEDGKGAAGGCSCLTLVGLAITLWLGLWHGSPTITLEQLDVFALNTTAENDNNRTTVYFDLRLKNRNFNKRVHYDALNVTLYYGANPIGNNTTSFPPFRQGVRKRTHRTGAVGASKGVVESARKAVERNGSAVFGVRFATAVRYTKLYFWTTGRHGLDLRADVAVDGKGSLVEPGVKLRSSVERVSKPRCCAALVAVAVASWVLLSAK